MPNAACAVAREDDDGGRKSCTDEISLNGAADLSPNSSESTEWQSASLHSIDKMRRKFLWAGGENISRGKCKNSWDKVCRPKDLGGLGVLDLNLFSRALRLRWLWFDWVDTDKPWSGTTILCDQQDKDLFKAAMAIMLGDGKKANFWHSHWLNDMTPKEIAPAIFAASRQKNRSVCDALATNTWISDINLLLITEADHLWQYVHLWTLIQNIELHSEQTDTITWKLTQNGVNSTKSAYILQFKGAAGTIFNQTIWKYWALRKCKFFSWLIIWNRV